MIQVLLQSTLRRKKLQTSTGQKSIWNCDQIGSKLQRRYGALLCSISEGTRSRWLLEKSKVANFNHFMLSSGSGMFKRKRCSGVHQMKILKQIYHEVCLLHFIVRHKYQFKRRSIAEDVCHQFFVIHVLTRKDGFHLWMILNTVIQRFHRDASLISNA